MPSTAPIKTIALLGAGGNVGAAILPALLHQGFAVTAVTRQSSNFTPPTLPSGAHGTLSVVRVPDDLPRASLARVFAGHDAVVNTVALNSDALAWQKTVIDAAVDAGVRRYIPSEFGCDGRNERLQRELAPTFAVKKEVVEYLRSLEDRISWTVVINGGILDWVVGIDLKRRTASLIDDGIYATSTSTLGLIGRWVAAILSNPAETANRYAPVESFSASQRDVLAAVHGYLGGPNFEIQHESGKTLQANALGALADGDPMGTVGVIRTALFVDGFGNNFHGEASEMMAKLGVEPEDLDTVVAAVLKNLGY